MALPGFRQILGQALRRPRGRWIAITTGIGYFLLYLFSLGHLVVDRNVVAPGDTPGFVIVSDWTTKSFERVGGFAYEPVAALYVARGVTLFIAPLNLFIGAILATLIALNVVTTAYALTVARSCRRLSWTGLLGSLPGLLTGFACCVPTVAFVLGANLALALISVQIFLLPLSLASLVLGLGWTLQRVRKELVEGGVSLAALAARNLGVDHIQGR
ncbi:MAG: hypothetical protein H0T72_14455 [Chloroflexia bacterium]|nr:hypothetical protein [Chloroflexia bacterium]